MDQCIGLHFVSHIFSHPGRMHSQHLLLSFQPLPFSVALSLDTDKPPSEEWVEKVRFHLPPEFKGDVLVQQKCALTDLIPGDYSVLFATALFVQAASSIFGSPRVVGCA